MPSVMPTEYRVFQFTLQLNGCYGPARPRPLDLLSLCSTARHSARRSPHDNCTIVALTIAALVNVGILIDLTQPFNPRCMAFPLFWASQTRSDGLSEPQPWLLIRWATPLTWFVHRATPDTHTIVVPTIGLLSVGTPQLEKSTLWIFPNSLYPLFTT